MIQLYARKPDSLDLTSPSNPFYIQYELTDGYVTFGNGWINEPGIVFGEVVFNANNGNTKAVVTQDNTFQIGWNYVIKFKVNKHIDSSPYDIVRAFVSEGGSHVSWFPDGSTDNTQAYELTLDNVQGTQLSFEAFRFKGIIYDIEVIGTNPNTGEEIIYVGGFTELDIDVDEKVVFNKALKDIRKPDKISGAYTKPFMLPVTKINQEFFGYLNDSDAVSDYKIGKKIQATINVDGINQINGNLQLIKIITNSDGAKYFNVIFYGDEITLFKKLDDLLLTDLDTTDCPINYTAANIKSKTDTYAVYDGHTAKLAGWDYHFGLIERGENHETDYLKTPLSENQYCLITPTPQYTNTRKKGIMEDSFVPVLFNPYLFKRIHEEQGYTVEGDVLNDRAFEDLIVPLNRAISSNSGLNIEDCCLNLNASGQTHSVTIGANDWVSENNALDVFTIGQDSEGVNIQPVNGLYSRFVPPVPVRANTKVELNISSILTPNANNHLVGEDPSPEPDNRVKSKFAIRIRFSLHPLQTYGEDGDNSIDIGDFSGYLDAFSTRFSEDNDDIHHSSNIGEEEANEFSYEFNIGKMMYYAKEYYGDDFEKYPSFKLKMYYDSYKWNENDGYDSAIDDAESDYADELFDNWSDYVGLIRTSCAPLPLTEYVAIDNLIIAVEGTYGKTVSGANAIKTNAISISSIGSVDTAISNAYSTYITDRDISNTNRTNNLANAELFFGIHSTDKMDCNFTIDTLIETTPSESDALLPFGKVIEDPSKHIGGEISQMDYIKNIITMFNLFVRIDELNKVVHYNLWEDFYADEIDDYTDKIILDKKIEKKFINDLVPRFMNFEFETLPQDENTIDYTTTYDENPSLYSHDSGNEFENKSVNSKIKSKFMFDIDTIINPTYPNEPYAIANVSSEGETKRIDNWGFSMMFWRKNINPHVGSKPMKLHSWTMEDVSQDTYYFDDIPLITNSMQLLYNVYQINSFGLPNRMYTTISPNYGQDYSTWITNYWGEFLKVVNSQQSFMLSAEFYLTAEDFYKIQMNNKIKIGNELYYINKIKDWNPNKPTNVELIKFIVNNTVEVIDYTSSSRVIDRKIKPVDINTNVSVSNLNENALSSSTDVTILNGEDNVLKESLNVLLSGSKNEIENSSEILIIGSSNSIKNSDNISLTNSNNVTVINSSNLVIDGEHGTTYINGVKYTESGVESSSSIINSGGEDSVQDKFTDAGLIDSGDNSVYEIDWKESYKVEDGGENII